MNLLPLDIARSLWNLHRSGKATNTRLLRERGQTLGSLRFRDACPDDIRALADLHVKAWNDTYRYPRNPPTYQIREHQWQEQFKVTDGSWFCVVVENQNRELIGFAKGKAYQAPELPDFAGELNKIYLARDYQRLGLGRRLVAEVARRFLAEGITSMVLFSEPQNPSGRFFEAMGAQRLLGEKGRFHGGYGWHDLEPLV